MRNLVEASGEKIKDRRPNWDKKSDIINFGDSFKLAYSLKSAVWVYDIDNHRVAYANAAACKLWQAEGERQLALRDLRHDMSSSVEKRIRQYQEDFKRSDCTFEETWTLYPAGKPARTLISFSPFMLPRNRMAMLCQVLGTSNDCSEKIRSTDALIHTDVMISLYTYDGSILYMNTAARTNAMAHSFELADIFLKPEDGRLIFDRLEYDLEFRFVSEVKTNSGVQWHDFSIKKCLDAVTGLSAILTTAVDVTDLKNARDRASFLAERDQLTGCFNRTYIQSYIESLSKVLPLENHIMLYFDIDKFKQINDRFGHEKGDEVLRQIVHRATAAVRKDDIIVRFGGDEFGILIKNVTLDGEIGPDVLRIQKALSMPIVIDATIIDVTVSMGMSSFIPGKAAFTEVMSEADIALYVAKQSGRNRACLFTEMMGVAARERDTLERDLKIALKNEEFVLYYQPRVDIPSGKVVGVEGLVRWDHPRFGIIMPDKFIPICEETGMIDELGQLVLEIGCRQAIDWYLSGVDITVSVNISPRQFSGDRLMSVLRKFASAESFPKGKVELEITESAIMGDHDTTIAKLIEIRSLGYEISIDDFGTGYSNLSNISRFPLSCLKIDRSFIGQLPTSGPVLELILALGRGIGAKVVAEGVEDQEQLDWLSCRSCDEVQGYLFSRPYPIGSLLEIIRLIDNRTVGKHSAKVSKSRLVV